ncbi:MAG: hypothetical protein IKU12_01920, partial [Oscillospiraceae bacterium]|nr:hypothetical protein [Oscillospiraceae bacterium]
AALFTVYLPKDGSRIFLKKRVISSCFTNTSIYNILYDLSEQCNWHLRSGKGDRHERIGY